MATMVRGRDTTWNVKFGGAWDGTPNWDANATNYTCYARSFTRETSIGTVEMGALCDTTEKHAPTRSRGQITAELVVDLSTGPAFQDKEGYYLQSIFDSGATTYTDYGMIESASLTTDVDGALLERVTVRLGVMGAAA